MKHALPLALLLGLTACGGGADTSTTTCPELSEPIMATAGKQKREYYKASGFNPKNKECWAMLRETAKTSARVSGSGATVIAFIDSPTFTPGEDGAYGKDDKVRQQVIAQVLVNNDAGIFDFTPDPFGYGKYTEPK